MPQCLCLATGTHPVPISFADWVSCLQELMVRGWDPWCACLAGCNSQMMAQHGMKASKTEHQQPQQACVVQVWHSTACAACTQAAYPAL